MGLESWEEVIGMEIQLVWGCLSSSPQHQHYYWIVCWPLYYSAWLASQLAWLELHREYTGYCQEEDEKNRAQKYRWAEGCYQSHLGFNGIPAAVPHKLTTSMKHALIQSYDKGVPTKYWVYKLLFRSFAFAFLYYKSFFVCFYELFKELQILHYWFPWAIRHNMVTVWSKKET